jgi:hypothetical protein
MKKGAMASKATTSNGKDFPGMGGGYREIGIAAVAAALRCQHMAAPEDEHAKNYAHDSSLSDRLP